MKAFWCILLLCQLGFAQQAEERQIDSILSLLPSYAMDDTLKVNALLNISRLGLKTRSLKGQPYANQALSISKKIGWTEGEARANFLIGNGYVIGYKNEEGMRHLKKAIALTNDPLFKSRIYFSMGAIYTDWSDYPKAIDVYFKSLKIKESLGVPEMDRVMLMANIASLYLGMEQNQKALDFLTKAYESGKPWKNKSYLAIIIRNMGVAHRNLRHFKKSLEYFSQADQIYKDLGDRFNQSQLLSDIALVYVDLKAYQKAIDYSKKSIHLNTGELENVENIGFSLGVIGDAYLELAKINGNSPRDLDSAAVYLKKAIKLHQELKMTRSLYDDYTSLSEVQKLRGHFEEAVDSQVLLIAYKDSIFNADNRETVKNLEDKRTIELRDKEIKINNLRLEAKEKQKWYLIGGLVLLGVIGLLLFNQSRNRRKTNDKLQSLNANLDVKNASLDKANKTNARFFGILNHDLRSPVYNLIHYLHLQKENPELLDDEMRKNIELQHMQAAENLLQSMEDLLLWSKGQMENFEPHFKDVNVDTLFAETKNHFSTVQNIRIHFENTDNIRLHTDENYLKTILRNLTGNAIKALSETQNATIHWKAWTQNSQTFLSITDNGPGGTTDQFKALYDDTEVVGIKSGLGLHLIRDLAKAIHCSVSVESQPSSGTAFTLAFAAV